MIFPAAINASADQKHRFFGMVGQSVLVLAMALLPFPLFYAGFEAAALWGWSSALSAVLAIAATLASLPVARPE